MTDLPHPDLAAAWRAARPAPAVVHLDSAAAGRSSYAVAARVADHLLAEAQLGGYVAQARAADELGAARDAVGSLLGHRGDAVAFTHSALDAVTVLLRALALPAGSRVLVTPGEYGPNLELFGALGLRAEPMPVADEVGHIDVDALRAALSADPPALVHVCALGSHRGVVQPTAEVVAAGRAVGVLTVVDAAQGLGHVELADVGADAVYATSRKWLAGPRGVGVLAVSEEVAGRLPCSVIELEAAEGFVAGRLGLGVAAAQHLSWGPARVRERLAAVGAMTRQVLDGVGGWHVVEPADEPSATTTLAPPPGWDDDGVRALRAELLADGVVVTYAGAERAPLEIHRATLRVSPHLDVSDDDLARLAEALGRHAGDSAIR